ncbi:MAG TPA: MltA domain-containing protein, partial [Rhodocyclaceae bacterium]|nr:MltA domain-containing protein [Rhodocyclaceae bacterium]
MPPLQSASWTDVAGWDADDHAQAWPALLESCKALGRRPQWIEVCSAANRMGSHPSRSAARHFFERHFEPWMAVNPDGNAEGLVTGYFEPLIKGSRQRSDTYSWPIRGVPGDMLTIDLGDVYPDLKNMRLRGRIVGTR